MAASGEAISCLTCYDATTAGHLAAAGVDVLLAGDSASQVILGHDSSIHAPLEFMLQITAALKRGAPDKFIMGDMPFMSYQADDAQAVVNAGRFLTEGRADAVKVEVNGEYGDLVGKLSRAGIPVVAHIGWRPQTAALAGVRTARIAGRTAGQVRQLVAEAQMMESRGAVMILIEQCPAEAAAMVVESVDLPVIGCGAGPACHGHVVVLQDLLGLSGHRPSFVEPVVDGGAMLRGAAEQWVQLLRSGRYLAEHPYAMDPGEAQKLRTDR